jgi:uncharacterized protein (DUF58 family)
VSADQPRDPSPEEAWIDPLTEIGELVATHLPRLTRTLRERYPPMGRVFVACLIVLGAASGAAGVVAPLFYLSLFMLSLLTVASVWAFVFSPRATLHRDLPERCAAGAQIEVRARVTNTGRFSCYDLTVIEHRPPLGSRQAQDYDYVEHLPPGESAQVVYRITFPVRGAYDLAGPVALSAYPFGITHARRVAPDRQRILVYPQFSPLVGVDLPVGRRHQPGGLQLVSHVGDSEEFVGLRDYRPGDRLRDVSHSGWARRGYPVVREFQQEYLTRIALVVDSHVPAARPKARDDLEAAISLGAAVTDALSRLEYVLDVFAVGPDLFHVQAGRSLAYLDTVLDVLACVEPCQDSPFETLGPAMRDAMAQISSAVVVLLDWDEERQLFVQTLRDNGVATKVVVVRAGRPTIDPSGFVGGEAGPVTLLTPEQVRAGTLERL